MAIVIIILAGLANPLAADARTVGRLMKHPEKIFSGDYSRDMWDEINGAKTIAQLRLALYVVCCRLQELESKIAAQQAGAADVARPQTIEVNSD